MEICEKLLNIAINGISNYYNKETGFFTIVISNKGEYLEKKALLKTYSLISLLGISEYEELIKIDVEKCLHGIMNRPNFENIRDLSLSLWLASKKKYKTAYSIFNKIKIFPLENFSSMEYAWLLTGLQYYMRTTDATGTKEIINNVKNILIHRFNKKTNLFYHKPLPRTINNLRYNIATFADQIYSVHALSEFYINFKDQSVKEILKKHSEKIISMQGPLGQWWWHSNASTGQIAGKYPVYTVHQDSMAPLAFLKLKEAIQIDYLPSVKKGLLWITGNNELNYNFLNTKKNIILRGLKRNCLLQKMQNICSLLHGNDSFIEYMLGKSKFKLIEKENSYHLGWILYAFNKKNRYFWSTN